MTPLIIGAEEKAALHSLKEYAESHPLTMDDMLDRMNGADAPGERSEFSRNIPTAFRVVFTIEPVLYEDRSISPGLGRHVSISVAKKGRCPSPEACQWIMDELGFQSRLVEGKCIVDMEGDAVSILEVIS